MSNKLRIAIITTDARYWLGTRNVNYPDFGTAIRALLDGMRNLQNAEIHVISSCPVALESPAKLASNVWFHELVVPKLGWGKSLYLGCISAVRGKLAEIRPDIVHGQGTERDCAISAVHSGFSNVVTIHGNMAELQRLGFQGNKLYGYLASILETHALKRTCGVFCNSAYTEALVAPRTHRTWRVPNAIRKEFFTQATRCPPAYETPRMLNVGIVTPRKRQLELLRMARSIANKGYRLKIVFAGGLAESTSYGAEFTRELRIAEKEGVAEYLGFLEVEQLVSLMDFCSGFVHFPSEEAFGLVVAEAMARGLKFFGSHVGGVRDITDGVAGPETYVSLEDLENGIVRWLDAGAPRTPDAAAEMRKRYHPQVIAEKHMEIYNLVIAKRII